MSKNIPIKAAKEFAEKYDKDQVIMLSWSRKDGLTWVTTYGKSIEDCDQASQGGNWLKKNLLNWPDSKCVAEPNRVKKLKEEIKKLKNELKNE